MKRTSWKVLALMTLVTAMAALPAHAQQAAGGDLAFAGDAVLPTFPCLPPVPGQFPCEGDFDGTIAGSLSGVHDSNGQDVAWAVEIAAPTHSDFSYFDLVQPGVPCTEGFARATSTFSGGLNQVFGAYGNNLPVPAPVTNIDATFNLEWRRIGATAAIRVSNFVVKLTVLGVGQVTVIDGGSGFSLAAFVPDLQPDHLAACRDGVSSDTDLNARIAGNAEVAWVTP